MELIPQWRQAWRMTSVNLPAIGLSILTFVEGFPDAFISFWSVLPADIRAQIPAEYIRYAGFALITLGPITRVIRQRGLDKFGGVSQGNGSVGK